MLRLLPFIGPKRIEFPDPDHPEHIYRAATREELIRKILNYRAQNELEPIEHLNYVLENYWCSRPENAGNCEPSPVLTRGWLHYLRGGITLFKYIAFGKDGMVPQEEADRRSAICAKCPKNVFPDKTKFVQWADSIADHATGGKKSLHHDELANCEICTCNLRAKVWQKPPIKLTPEEKVQMEEVGCWQPKVSISTLPPSAPEAA